MKQFTNIKGIISITEAQLILMENIGPKYYGADIKN